ncbi:hypothetical protein [Niallia endozanthoxylica]|nr:hypothetical protein [Niallia endozanthoxylica]
MDQNYGNQSGHMPNMPNEPDMKSLCMKYRNYHVITQMSDGTQMEGIIEDVDEEGVTMLVPEDIEADDRVLGFGGYGGYGRRRFRRFRRHRYPFFFFGFPFIFPFPYYY